MRFGVQLFGIGKQIRKNPEKIFHMLSNYGLRFVEPCIVLGESIPEYPQFWTAEEYAELATKIKSAGLKAESCHILIKENQDLAVQMMKILAEKYNFRQFVLGCPDEVNRTVYQDFSNMLIALAKELKTVHAEILLHNDKNAVWQKIEEVSAYEWLLQKCDGFVYAEPDVGWLLAAGEEPEKFLWRNKKYIKALHYKDMKETVKGELAETAIGTGIIDMTSCFQFARAAEVIQYLDQDTSEGDIFTDIKNASKMLAELTSSREHTVSILCILDTETGKVRKLHKYNKIVEAPNWLSDGDTLIYNSEGRIFRYQISDDSEKIIDSGFCNNCNNDHVPSPNQQYLAVSHSDTGWMSQIYILPMEGGTPRLVTPNAPSFLHGWSPDGKELAYCAFRKYDKKTAVDIYKIDVEGGKEERLTKDNGFNDGPEYSPDGKEIWFNSTRTGLMQIWKMNRDGTGQRQMTFENQNNWFAHISTDQKKVINIAYSKEGLDPEEHLPNMAVEIWIMNYDGSERRKLHSFFGGQGSVNVNSWSPDSKKLAFVMYELLHK
ncbi:MAG: hypothetical protein K2P25_02100 [Lachnospiraceae bacterium]|nr:hypothetical protein [Lachnospiraceae bacterium]